MNFLESARIAMRSLSANKMRSSLTMLGIIIGVTAVIAMLSIGRGAQAAITNQITSIGTNLLYVRPGAPVQAGVRAAEGSAATLTMEDGDAISSVTNIVGVAPEVDSFGQLAYLGNNTNGRILGTTPDYLNTLNAAVADGDFFTTANVTSRSAVVVIGSGIATSLFDTAEPVGQSIRINGQTFRVLGVMQSKGGTGFLNADNQVFMPITTAISRLSRGGRSQGGNSVQVLNIKISDTTAQDQVVQDVAQILDQRHHVVNDDFTVQSQQDILNTANQVTGTLTIFLGGVAAISLIVGGIGIMNIMLVSVTERTREIGIRKAVGARKSDILMQFLTEATILSLTGGLLGILFGAIIAHFISGIQIGGSAITAVVDPDAALLAVLFSAGIGLFFGSYPASRAAGLHPIDALRYE